MSVQTAFSHVQQTKRAGVDTICGATHILGRETDDAWSKGMMIDHTDSHPFLQGSLIHTEDLWRCSNRFGCQLHRQIFQNRSPHDFCLIFLERDISITTRKIDQVVICNHSPQDWILQATEILRVFIHPINSTFVFVIVENYGWLLFLTDRVARGNGGRNYKNVLKLLRFGRKIAKLYYWQDRTTSPPYPRGFDTTWLHLFRTTYPMM